MSESLNLTQSANEIEPFERITAHIVVNHEQGGLTPYAVGASFDYRTFDSRTAYRRRLKVGRKPQPLDMGGMTQTSCVILENKTGQNLAVNPTPEEQERISKAIVRICFSPERPALRIRPGRALFIDLMPDEVPLLCCPDSEAILHVAIFPE